MTDKIKEIFESGKSDKEIVEELMSIVSASKNHQHQFSVILCYFEKNNNNNLLTMLTQSYVKYFAKILKKRYLNHSSIEMIEISIDIFAQLKRDLNFVSNVNPMLVLENEFKDVEEDYKKAYQSNVDFCREKISTYTVKYFKTITTFTV